MLMFPKNFSQRVSQLIIFFTTYPLHFTRTMEPIPADIGEVNLDTPGRTPMHHRADPEANSYSHSNSHTPIGNLE